MILWYEILVIYYFMCCFEENAFLGSLLMLEDIGKFCMQALRFQWR
jgi:hypothetical protein